MTGTINQLPANGVLFYTVYDQLGQVLGNGTLAVSPAGGGGQFSAQVTFRQPEGNAVQLELYALDPVSGAAVGTLRLALTVAE